MSSRFTPELGTLHFQVDFEGLNLVWMPANSLQRNGSTSWGTLVDLVTQIPAEGSLVGNLIFWRVKR